MSLLTDTRREQTLHAMAQVRAEVVAWLDRRRTADRAHQHRTQLGSLEHTLLTALDRLRTVAVERQPAGSLQAFELYRDVDAQVVLVRRLWRWFADKYDQRDDPDQARLLLAADEVVWAVHAQAHRAHGSQSDVPPAPLPYVDDLDAPEAVPRDEPDRELRGDDFDDVVTATLARLPVPVIGLPGLDRGAPWSWVLIGHEVGHHLQYDLLPQRRLVAEVGTTLERTVGGEQGTRWRAWSQEIFADLVGLASLGPGLIGALVRYELGGPDRLLDRGRGRYPAPLVRLRLLEALCTELALPVPEDLGALDTLLGPVLNDPAPEDPVAARRRAAVQGDLEVVAAVAKAVVTLDVDGSGTVPALLGTDPAAYLPGGRVARRTAALRHPGVAHGEGLQVVRELAAASAAAWQQVQAIADARERQDAAVALTAETVDQLIRSREPSTRGATAETAVTDSDVVALLTAPVVR